MKKCASTLRLLVQVAADHHVLDGAHAEEDLQVLEGARETEPRQLVRGHAGDVLAGEQDAPAARRVETGDHVEQRGLAGAVRADHGKDLAGLDCEAHAVERR